MTKPVDDLVLHSRDFPVSRCNKESTESSDFIYNAIITGLSPEWKISSTVTLEFNVVEHARRRFSFALDDSTPLEISAKSGTGSTLGVGVLF